ncbi:MAG: hypothetical protein LBE11_02605 [Prevotellaceae bacterium]|jgi:hypothetical protein|nr:hypothetical protein [Prevotellaceae bacterium]
MKFNRLKKNKVCEHCGKTGEQGFLFEFGYGIHICNEVRDAVLVRRFDKDLYKKKEFIAEEDHFPICKYPVKYDFVKLPGIKEKFIKQTVAVYKMLGKDSFHICDSCSNKIDAFYQIRRTVVKSVKKYGKAGGTVLALTYIILIISALLRLQWFDDINILKMIVCILAIAGLIFAFDIGVFTVHYIMLIIVSKKTGLPKKTIRAITLKAVNSQSLEEMLKLYANKNLENIAASLNEKQKTTVNKYGKPLSIPENFAGEAEIHILAIN